LGNVLYFVRKGTSFSKELSLHITEGNTSAVVFFNNKIS